MRVLVDQPIAYNNGGGPRQDFSIAKTPASQTVNAGSSTTFSMTVTPTSGFTGWPVTFSVSGLPAGVSASFSPATLTGPGSTTLTLTTSSSLPSGTYTIVLVAITGLLSHSASAGLTILGGTSLSPILYDHLAQSNWDSYTGSTSPTVRAFILSNVFRVTSYTPYFDDKLAWYPNARVYVDISVLYTTLDAATVAAHPDWVLRDGAGNPLYNPSPGEYAGNIASAAFRAWKIAGSGAALAGVSGSAPSSYIGLLVDDVNTMMTVVNAGGTATVPIDTNTSAPMTQLAWSGYMVTFVQAMRAAYSGVEICHNSVWFSTALSADVNACIDAANRIICERGFGDAGLTGGPGGSLRDFMNYVDFVHGRGKPVNILDYYSGQGTSNPNNLHYSTAGYLLVWEPGDHLEFDDLRPDPLYWPSALFSMPIGSHTSGRSQPDSVTYPGVWRRDFASGVAVLNEPGAASVTYPLGATYYDEFNTSFTSITLGPMSGAVLRGPYSVTPPPPPAITPYIQVNGGAWQNVATATVNSGDTVNLGPQPIGGTWTWTGPSGFTSSLREIDAIPLSVGTDAFIATYTDPGTGASNTQTFTLTVTSTGGPPPGPSYYVATTGNDSNVGSLASPFLTLGHAQSVMQSSGTKTTTVRGGTYTLSGDWNFSSADNSTAWLGYPGETAIIDGASAHSFISVTVSGISFTRLIFQHFVATTVGGIPACFWCESGTTGCSWDHCVFQNMDDIVIEIYGGSGNTITNCTFQNIGGVPSGVLFFAAITISGSGGGHLIQHNLFTNLTSQGVSIAGTVGTSVTDTIDRNKFLNVCLDMGGANPGDWDDGGAIYSYQGTNALHITNNWIENVDPTYWNDNGAHGGGWNGCRGIYLDGGTSNATVTGNIIIKGARACFIYNGGRNNIVQNNIFNVSAQTAILASYNSWGFTDMASNSFQRNIIYSSGSAGSTPTIETWEVSGTVQPPPHYPSVSSNLYYPAGGGTWTNPFNGINDTSPTYANPQFANPSAGNYSMPGTSPAFTVIGFTPLPTDIGPQ